MEVVVVDDGSTDDSLLEVEGFRAKFDRFQLIRNQRNLGGGAARNIGVLASNYEIIGVIDADDIVAEGSIGKALEYMQQMKEIDAIAHGEARFFVTNPSEPIRSLRFTLGNVKFSDLLDHNPSPVIGNMYFRRAAFMEVGGYPENHGFDTQGFGFRLLGYGKRVKTVDFMFYYQRIPEKPSYYIRQVTGYFQNSNWFYIYFEFLYRFPHSIRRLILDYECFAPRRIGMGPSLHDLVVNSLNRELRAEIDSNPYANPLDAELHGNFDGDSSMIDWVIYRNMLPKKNSLQLRTSGITYQKSIKSKFIYMELSRYYGTHGLIFPSRALTRHFDSGRSILWYAQIIFYKIIRKLSKCHLR